MEELQDSSSSFFARMWFRICWIAYKVDAKMQF
jgi:hypothetical protein